MYKQKLKNDEKSLGLSQNLEAFVYYQRMYRNWWLYSSTRHTNGHRSTVENGDVGHDTETTRHSENEESQMMVESESSLGEESWLVLFSEPHVFLQSTQKAIEAIQSRIAMLIQQHNCPQERQRPNPQLPGESSELEEKISYETAGDLDSRYKS